MDLLTREKENKVFFLPEYLSESVEYFIIGITLQTNALKIVNR